MSVRIAKIGVKMSKIWLKQDSRDLFAKKIYKGPIWNFFWTRKDCGLILKKLRISLAKVQARRCVRVCVCVCARVCVSERPSVGEERASVGTARERRGQGDNES